MKSHVARIFAIRLLSVSIFEYISLMANKRERMPAVISSVLTMHDIL